MDTVMREIRQDSGEKQIIKPTLPKEFLKISPLWTTCFVGYAVLAYLLPAAAIYWVVVSSELPVALQVILVFLLAVLSQQGLHLLGWVGHEGFHFNLHKNKYVSSVLGIVFSSMIGTFMQVGAAISHWNHHRYTNRKGDPDIELFTHYRELWQRMLFARMAANRQYMRNVWRMALGLPLPYEIGLPLGPGAVKALAWLNIVLSFSWVSIYAFVIYLEPVAGSLAILLPHMLGILYTGLRSYLEHAGTGVGQFRDSRTRLSPFFSVVYFFNNYHLEHHLYPKVPCYNLRSVHQFLKTRGYFDEANSFVERGVLHNYAYASGRFQYPDFR